MNDGNDATTGEWLIYMLGVVFVFGAAAFFLSLI